MITLQLTETDIEYCLGLAKEGMQLYLQRRGQTFEESLWRARLPEFSLILMDGIRVGFISLIQEDGYMYWNECYLQPEHRDKGFGKQVMEQVCDGREVRLDIYRENRALNLFKRYGFQVIEQRFDSLKLRRPLQTTSSFCS